jgi:YidC/Oxa1 family membrane protein insertase
MSAIFGVPVDAAYSVVSTMAAALTPLTGGLAVAIAIVVSTILRQRHRADPDRLTREARALYRDNGTSMFAGYLPLLLQWPLLSVMYLLFRSGTVGGRPNTLLRHHLFTARLGAHWLTAPGPLSLQGATFAALLVLLTLAGYLAVRVSRRLFPPSPSASPWLARVTPLLTPVFALFLPLAGVLCLLTTTAWTVLERRVLARHLPPARPATPREADS